VVAPAEAQAAGVWVVVPAAERAEVPGSLEAELQTVAPEQAATARRASQAARSA
jgi:hypothetical protein